MPDWLRVGVEWGCGEMFFKAYHYNYISDEGYRVDEEDASTDFHFNGAVYVNAMTPVSRRISLGLAGGYVGAGKRNRMFPIMARMHFYQFNESTSGLFHTLDAGIGIHESDGEEARPVAGVFRIGSGYHYVLGGRCSVDLRGTIRMTLDGQRLVDVETGSYVEERNIRRNNAAYCALEFTIAVNF